MDIYYINTYLYTFLKIKQPETTHLFAEYVFMWRQNFQKSCQNQTPSSGGYPASRSVFKQENLELLNL